MFFSDSDIKINPESLLIEDLSLHLQILFSRITEKSNDKWGEHFPKSKLKNVRARRDLRDVIPLPFKDEKSESQRGYLRCLRSHSSTEGCVTSDQIQSTSTLVVLLLKLNV